MEQDYKEIYSRDTLEFVTVAAELCAYLEQSAGRSRLAFVDTLLKILPLLYLKASVLNFPEENEDVYLEELVTETDYEYVRGVVAVVMGEQDDYLDVFVRDMKYSDTPIIKTISEDVADIYQALRNFVGIYKEGFDESMYAALMEVLDNFRFYWGQTLVNTLRALHDVRYNQRIAEEID